MRMAWQVMSKLAPLIFVPGQLIVQEGTPIRAIFFNKS